MFKFKYIVDSYMRMETIRRQSLMSVFFQIVLTVIGFFTTIYFARTVGADVLGAYFLFLSYLGIINMMSSASIEGAAVKRISEEKEQNEYFSAFVVLRVILLIVLIIILFIFKNYFQDLNNSGMFIWLIIILIISLFNGIITSGITGRGKIGVNVVGSFTQVLFQNIFQIIAVYLGYKVGGLAFGFAVGLIAFLFIQLRFFDLHLTKFNKQHIKSLLSFSFWSILSLSGSMVFIYADTILIGYFMKNSDVGIYRIIFQFTSVTLFTTLALGSALYVKISFWNQNNKIELIEKSFSKSLTYSLMIAIPLCIGGIMIGDKLLYFLYGAEFSDYTTLILLFIVQIVCIINYFLRLYMTAMNNIKETFKIISITASLNILLNFLLIPIVGIVGAAIATLISIFLNVILSQRSLKQQINLKLEFSSLLNIFKSSIIMGIIVGLYRLFIPLNNITSVLISIILCGIIYIVLILKFDKDIYNELKNIVINI